MLSCGHAQSSGYARAKLVSGGGGGESHILSTNLANFIQLRQNDRAAGSDAALRYADPRIALPLMLLAHLCTSLHNGELKVSPLCRLRFAAHSDGVQVIVLSIK